MKLSSKISLTAVFVIALWAVILTVLLVTCSGCNLKQIRAYRQAEREAIAAFDSLKKVSAQQTAREEARSQKSSKETEVREGVKGDTVGITLDSTELKPVTDADGKKQGRKFRNENGKASVEVVVGKDGKVNIKCKHDSLMQVIRHYREDSVSITHRYDSLGNEYLHRAVKRDTVQTTKTATTKEVKKPLIGWFKAFLIGVLLGYVFRWHLKSNLWKPW